MENATATAAVNAAGNMEQAYAQETSARRWHGYLLNAAQ